MPKFEKSSPELVARFDAAAARFPEAERRKMFGYPALLVGGKLVTGLFAESWMIRLGDADREALQSRGGARPSGPSPGQPQNGETTPPQDGGADDAQLDDWVRRSIAFGRSLPSK